ncbi:unnamed protein product [Didymodactylos carnosus]|uniref:Uncharacterized protein n=1 Tax=Didymodactylos carnosus TaxID=1234261 RepID=A0A815HSY0_9BILA|nr:unnamed protein product [Didymodactylos carnosus]CAF1354663.1 unnamed protein product [Didymodactylos carnosus]CAF3967200.1 unnamed protein product [Didymodactylos carnosus]CAF4227546.1 unnamed protein product [Didymodactylos carnosus]
MLIGELNNLKKSINELISMNTFLSASIDRQHVLTDLSNINPADDLQRVLFEINADPRVVTTKPFAKITPHGAVGTEAEVFFMLGSIIRLTSIRRDEDQICIIQMVLCGGDEHVIVFDEIGLAELSPHNPLEVLHAEFQIENCQYGFVGISNWRVDASKMNRALYLLTPDPDVKDL